MSETTNEASVQSVVVPRPGLFRVFRTSETRCSPNKAPCLEATAYQCVKRDVGYSQAWFVELTDVMEFVREYGECVLSVDNDGFNCIEIYDDYRE